MSVYNKSTRPWVFSQNASADDMSRRTDAIHTKSQFALPKLLLVSLLIASFCNLFVVTFYLYSFQGEGHLFLNLRNR